MVDILFIYNDCSAHSHYSTGLGIASISAYLQRHGFTTDLIYYKTDVPEDALVERVRRADPAAVSSRTVFAGSRTTECPSSRRT